MALRDAILVCLTEGPLSGYDLARRFDTSIGFFWHADHQQIYRELRKLKADGLVADELVVQRGRPNKNLYSITAAGRRRLLDWSAVHSPPPSVKDDLMVKLYALAHVDRDSLAEQIRERLDGHRERLALYRRILETGYAELDAADAHQTGRHLGLRLGLRYESELVGWCEDALRTLAALASQPGRP